MASVDEINAGFDAAILSLTKLANTVVPDHDIPFVGNLRRIALDKMKSPDGRAVVLEEVKQILGAAENVRASAAKA